MTAHDILHEASALQIRTSDPERSVWLSANAGSGKTKVLTDRVARLLLGGTEPQRILCLTYTKAAASEMQNRLLKRLGSWAMLTDEPLRAELSRLGVAGPVAAERLAQARRLFAQAIEAPGGLKIQTIHSFCGTLLRRFPLEAGVPHGFSELDDRSAADLRDRITEEIASGPDRAVLDALADEFASDDLGRLIDAIGANADAFTGEVSRDDLRAALGLPAGFGPEDIPGLAFGGDEKALIDEIVPVLKAQSAKTMKALGEDLAALDLRTPGMAELRALQALFLKASAPTEAKIASIPTKKAAEALGEDLTEELHALMLRTGAAKDAEFALDTLRRTEALHRFARIFLPRYRARKAAGGWLDFDDLIERAGALLSRGSVAQWVLFRLDGGIDHILVDEAQDTSPGQWKVIDRLADEFTAGEGARDERRTIFVVGDRKQSIYSFQGADLRRYEDMRTRFAAKFEAIGQPLESSELRYSFRSSSAILSVVDRTFAGPAAAGLGGAPSHIAFHSGLPGRVDLWPPVAPPEDGDDGDWENPVDLPGKEDASVILARTIADEIREMIRQGVRIPEGEGSRPVHEGDFLILVQRRSRLFSEVIRACKAAGLAVAGADRLRLGAEIAVKDIVSVLSFLATPEDDLSLAEALRSPVFGWTESELYDLAEPRKGYLWTALRASSTRPETLSTLQDLLDQTDFLRPFDLIERLLNRHDARRRLIARLGPEAEDGIDELIAQALAYETAEIPSLTGFLGWLGADEIEIKRQLENEGRTIRVMTVHGSKGLESPIVILPDTAKPAKRPRPAEITRPGDGPALWKGGGPAPERLKDLQEEEQSRAGEEKMRLLYVALTRAEKWLIVTAAGETGSGEESWYALVEGALAGLPTAEAEALSEKARSLGPLRRFSAGEWPEPAAEAQPGATAEPAPAPFAPPAWLYAHAPRPERPEKALSPSDLGGAKALTGESAFAGDEEAKRHGRQLHLLLEHLPGTPPDDWPGMAEALLSSGEDRAEPGETEEILATARQVIAELSRHGFAGPEALAEVEITAALPELNNCRIHGTIDRLLVTASEVRVLDYKSNTVVPDRAEDVPLGLVRQLAAYRAALLPLYPGKPIRCALLWTATGRIMELPEAQMVAALRNVTAS